MYVFRTTRAARDGFDMRKKVLSLELLQSIIENAGPVLRTHERFINHAVKKFLCISLLVNGVSPVPLVFSLSLNVFSSLIANFQDYLKVNRLNEYGVIVV